jgi:hypothetical protein
MTNKRLSKRLVMNRHQYKPDLSVRHSPRVSSQRRAMVSRICKRHEMPEADVLRYSLEAAVLTSGEKLERATSSDPGQLDDMMTVRTSRAIDRRVDNLCRNSPNVLKTEILRALLEQMLGVAERRGMAYVMRLREEALVETQNPKALKSGMR